MDEQKETACSQQAVTVKMVCDSSNFTHRCKKARKAAKKLRKQLKRLSGTAIKIKSSFE